ncbi:hypothetical protein [Microbaculum marinum]|uniref:Uncharacterized protein n=1 Tax=Microbaculum marinum TaxID=1764581 RepID=A0AAW9RGL0_9HYPH
MRLMIRALTAMAIAATVIAGAGPSCTSTGSGWSYSTSVHYANPYRDGGYGPGLGCQRIPAPSQC